MAEPRDVVLAVGIDERAYGGQALICLMVIDDDDFAAKLGGARERLVLVVPQSTVTMRRAPSLTRPSIAAGLGP